MAIILGAQSNIWTQLTLPNPPAGGVPFVAEDSVTIAVDPDNFSYNSDLGLLNVKSLGTGIQSTITNPSGVVTANVMAGLVQFAPGISQVIINNTLATVLDIVFTQTFSNDATATLFKAAVGPGTITLTANSAATSITIVAWMLLKQGM